MAEDTPYADPSDLQFGKAAKEKQEAVDALEEQGETGDPGAASPNAATLDSADLDGADLDDEDDTPAPRAGNKAPVDEPPAA